MNRRMALALFFILGVGGFCWAQEDAALRSQVQALYTALDGTHPLKDFEGQMSLYAENYEVILAGMDRNAFRDAIRKMFDGNEQLRAEHTILTVGRSGDLIKVVCDEKREGKSGDADWKVLVQQTRLDFLIQEGGLFKFFRSATFDKKRLDSVAGDVYTDKEAGFSFAVPEHWEVIPSVHLTMKGFVLVLAPDRSSLAMFGYVNIPGITAQQAIEGDEGLSEKLSKAGTYKLYKSGPISIGGHDGFMTDSKFCLPNTQERRRLRAYFNAKGSLYVLCFDAIPFTQWDAVKDGFQSVLDSVKWTE